MKVTSVSYTRVRSDRAYGNHQATVNMLVEDGDDPGEAMAEAKSLACQAVQDGFGYLDAEGQAPEEEPQYNAPPDVGDVGEDDDPDDDYDEPDEDLED